MKKSFLKIGLGQYLGDVLEVIPSNVIIHKTVTNIGATTLELTYPRHSIIVEPNVPVIKGKRTKYKDVLGVLEGIYSPDIKAYLLNDTIEFKKILTTPESFNKVKQAIEEIGYELYEDFFLLFDECDRITTDIDFRESIALPLEDFFSFKNKAFISATAREISDDRFDNTFEIMEIIPDYDFSNSLDIITTINPKSAFKSFIDDLSLEKDETPICIFFNSIDGIVSLISELGIGSESTVFCSENGEDKIRKNRLTVSTDIATSKMKRFNFFTSRFYSAVDIYLDYKPHVVFLTDLNIALHSLLDPYSDMVQIAGRFRNGFESLTQITNFKNDMPYLTPSEANIFLETNKQVYRTIETLRDTTTTELAKDVISELLSKIYYSRFYIDGGNGKRFNHFLHDNFLLSEIKKGYYLSIDNLKMIFENDKIKRYFNATFRNMQFEFKSIYTNNLDFKYSFHEVVTKVADILEEISNEYPNSWLAFDNRPDIYQEVKKRHPFIVDAYEILGYERLVQYGYSKALISKELQKFNKELGLENIGFRKELNMNFEVGKYYPQKELLDVFYRLNEKYGLTFKREVGELERFFELGSIKSKPYPKCRLLIGKKFND
ncbi:hypothetical protein [Sphingobacterium athyrii]|uniref:Uncharacterized protein n=1 Tax=Sphingobacterium athyrii TaxID=2152717 RepID=A0A363NUT0_9SPHI|nr:hypothetical protein [Sphingobacterium athyrii]PUV24539.1 hypothetical protein DCO56_14450 [Sphingobacterium athyrii]